MNAFLKKEIRLLLPSFLIGCALTFSNLFLLWKNHDALSSLLSLLPMVVCPAVAVMMALDSFGVEVSSGTFTSLLAQPVSRLKIWQTKISLLAVALLVVGILWVGSIFCISVLYPHASTNIPDNSKALYDLFVVAVMFALVVFSGGLWTVLLLRQVAAAFWFTLLVPGMIMVLIVGLFAGYSGEFVEGMTVSVLGLYSLAGFFFARRLFFRAQDVQWSGGTIAMPEMRGLPAWLAKAAALRIHRPRAALWRKEFQLHQSQLIMAFALLLLHLGVLATRHFYDLRRSSDLKFVLEAFWGLWLVMPVLVGCAAVAEERKLGTLEGQLCLPAKRRTQFAVKFSVMLFLSVLLGVAMPLLLEGARILPLLVLLVIAAAFGVISFYVSSLMRNTLQTLAPSMLGIGLMWFAVIMLSQSREIYLDYLWHGPLPYFVGGPVLLLALLLLAFGNFQQVRAGWQMWRRNFLMLALALAFAVTAATAIYHRAWEKLTPFEPAHGAARLSLSNPASLDTDWSGISVRLPDGKVWMAQFTPGPGARHPLALMLGNIRFTTDEGRYINGTNWLTVQRAAREFVGLKTDGSLWVSEKPWNYESWENGKWKIHNDPEVKRLVPFGSETNWSSFGPAGLSVLLVKNDGTLWRWGVTTNYDFRRNAWPGLRAFTPYRLGTESNWAAICGNGSPDQMFLRQTDGSLWTWNNNSWNTNSQTLLPLERELKLLPLEPGFTLQSMKNPGRDRFRSVAAVYHGLQYRVGVRDDGTFRIWGNERLATANGKRYRDYESFPTDRQIGDGTNWLAVAGRGDKIITLKSDGSLWLWDFQLNSQRANIWDTDGREREIQTTRPVRLGTHSDWIAISGGWGDVNTLAADGSLWFWPLERVDYYVGSGDNGNGSHLGPLLDISHKPQLLGNIFGRAD